MMDGLACRSSPTQLERNYGYNPLVDLTVAE